MEKDSSTATTRNIWLEWEVLNLLEIIREEKIHQLFDGKRYKNAEIYKLVESKMKEKGVINKNAEQIKNKWKALKTSYTSCKKSNSVSGAQRNECDYYEILDDILGTRPSSVLEGLDIEVELDPTISESELSQLLSPTSTEANLSRSSSPQPGSSRNLSSSSVTPSTDKTYNSKKNKVLESHEFFEHQKELMKQFFEYQREAEERAAQKRSEDLKNILNVFQGAVATIVKSQPLAHPGYPMQFMYPPGAVGANPNISSASHFGVNNAHTSNTVSKKSDKENDSDEDVEYLVVQNKKKKT